jgi:ABC-type lipoprotein export system ATPase subunit
VTWCDDEPARKAQIRTLLGESGYACALVSPDMPLRVNLTALENIALITQFHHATPWQQASEQAQTLLDCTGHGDIALKRDEDLSMTQRFAVKMARAIMLRRPLVAIDRPALMLADVHYPEVLRAMLACLQHEYSDHCVVDYIWNRPVYEYRK